MKKSMMTLLIALICFPSAYALEENPKIQYTLAAVAFREGRYDSAYSKALLFVSRNSSNWRSPYARMLAADSLFFLQRYPEAASLYRDVFKDAKTGSYLSLSAEFRLGECNYNLQKYRSAIEHFDHVSKSTNSSLRAEALLALGHCYMALRDFGKAEDTLLLLFQSYPGYERRVDATVPMGLIYLSKDNYKTALDYFQYNPQAAPSMYYAGVAQRKLGHLMAATQILQDLWKSDPKGPWADRAKFQIGEAFLQAEEYPLAFEAYSKVFNEYPASRLRTLALYKMACVDYILGRYQDATNKWEQLMRQSSDDPSRSGAHFMLGELALKTNNMPDAMLHFNEAAKSEGLSMEASYKMLWALAKQGQDEQAIAKSEKFLQDYPWGDVAAKTMLLVGFCQQRLAHYPEAIAMYLKVADVYRETTYWDKAMYLAAVSYYKAGELGELITSLYQSLKLAPPAPSPFQARAYIWVAEGLYDLQKYAQARVIYQFLINNYNQQTDVQREAYQGLAACLAQEGNYEEASKTEDKAIQMAMGSKDASAQAAALLSLADSLFDARNYEKAASVYTEFAGHYPDDPNAPKALFQAGVALYRQEYFTEAIKRWDALASAHPNDPLAPKALLEAGKTYFEMGKFDEAKSAFEPLSQRYATSDEGQEALIMMGQCAYNKGDYKAAMEDYKSFLNQNGKDKRAPEVAELMQMALFAQSKTPEQMKALAELYDQGTFTPEIYWKLGAKAFEEKQYPQAETYFTKIVVGFPHSTQAEQSFFYLGETAFRQKNYKQAVTNFENFVQNYPQDPLAAQARFRIALANFNAGDYLAAAQSFNNVLELNPNDSQTRDAAFNVPLCYKKADKPYQAIEAYDKFLTRYPQDPEANKARLGLGAILEETKQGDKAVTAYLSVPKGTPEYLEAQFSAAKAYRDLGSTDLSRQICEKLAATQPASDKFRIAGLILLGEFQEKAGQTGPALKTYQEIVRSSQNPDWTAAAQERIDALKGGK